MSTRAVIGRKTEKGFRGVYHHWDGYPSGLGATLFGLWNGHFQRDTEAMLQAVIDDHPVGWITINGADFSKPACTEGGPKCYCHDAGRNEKAQTLTQRNASACGCEWAYVFDGNGKMEVQSSYCDPNGKHSGAKMVGMFGMGDPKAVWRTVAVVELAGTEPDWKKMDRGAYGD